MPAGPLLVGFHEVSQRDVWIAVARIWIFLRHGQLDGVVRTGVDAGQAGLTVSRGVDGFVVDDPDRSGRADPFTDAAADAGIVDGEQMLPGICRHLCHPV